jgi:hypothetical protein
MHAVTLMIGLKINECEIEENDYTLVLRFNI